MGLGLQWLEKETGRRPHWTCVLFLISHGDQSTLPAIGADLCTAPTGPRLHLHRPSIALTWPAALKKKYAHIFKNQKVRCIHLRTC